uniref:Uncharacterized protein n=1 Tax=Rhizophora mucronata TaxID=61149 RepID=A0A2P2PD25_RHIMU
MCSYLYATHKVMHLTVVLLCHYGRLFQLPPKQIINF